MINYHCDIKDLELSIGVRHVTSTMLKVVGKTGTIFFLIFNQFCCGWGCKLYSCAYYTQDFIVIHIKPLSSGNNVYTNYIIIISMLYCMSAVNC